MNEAQQIDELPHWACGRATWYGEIGAVLATRDGRKIGNATVIGPDGSIASEPIFKVRTDAGDVYLLTFSELLDLFHEPVWLRRMPACPYCDRPVACSDAPGCPLDDFTGGSFTDPIAPIPCPICGDSGWSACERPGCDRIPFLVCQPAQRWRTSCGNL